VKGRKPTPKPEGEQRPPPPVPKHLRGNEAKREWERVAALLSRRRVLTEEDHAALLIYCEAWQQYLDASEQLAEHGTVVLSNTGTPIKNPYLTVQKQAFDRMRPLLSEFGLTPCARARLKQPDDEDADGTGAADGGKGADFF
jgi:P27 family predicted phage terminase small subunit